MRSRSLVIATLLLLSAVFGCLQSPSASGPERVFFDNPATWVAPLPALRVSGDETWAVFGQGKWLELVDLETGRGDEEQKRGNLETVTDIAFSSDGELVRRGTKAGETGWFPDGETIVYSARADGRFQIFEVPRAGGASRLLSDDRGNLMQPQVSPDGRWIAATRIEFTRELWRQRR